MMTNANSRVEKKAPSSQDNLDDLTMVTLMWMGASANALRHHVPKGIGRVHTMGAEDDASD